MKKSINKYDLTANDIISFGNISILNGEIHTRVELWSLKAFKKLNFKARDDVRYGLYLDYDLYNDKCKLRYEFTKQDLKENDEKWQE